MTIRSLILLLFICISQISLAEFNPKNKVQKSDTVRIKNDLIKITKTTKSRNFFNIETLNEVAAYIYNTLLENCDTVYYQTYMVNGTEYKNVIGSIGIDKQERIVLGAHYDVAYEQEGADDNASGLVGILELSRLLSKEKLNYRIDFVAYTLEEPPFFRSDNMGSYIHAKSLFDSKVKVKGMICLEMIAFFKDSINSQTYPLDFLRFIYGRKGNYITVVQKFGNGRFGRRVKRLMKRQDLVKTKSFRGPAILPGIDFSDHLNYWKFNYSAVMITDTSFYRNGNYHNDSDKMETLDLKRMALVIDQVYWTVKKL